MPTKRSKDSKGSYYQWGSKGKKYYYSSGDESSRKRAKSRADKQGRAIGANK